MAREHESYRDNYEALLTYFGRDHMLLTAREVGRYCGKDARTVSGIYNISKHGITIPTLARRMCN